MDNFDDIPETLYGPQKRARWVHSVLSTLDNPDILDIGCGTGELLTAPLAKRGWRITATDVHLGSIEHAQKLAKDIPNVRFIHGTPDDAPGPYDAIILSEVLEHVDDPAGMLRYARSFLKPAGILIVTVPNGRGPFEIDQWFWKRNFLWIPSLHARYLRSRGAHTSTATFNDDSPHVNFFTRAQLDQVTAAAGFEIVSFQPRTFIAGSFPSIVVHVLKMARLPTRGLVAWNARISDRLPDRIASGWMFLCRQVKSEAGR